MPLPPELRDLPEACAIVGDVDAFMEYVVTQAPFDWEERIAQRWKEWEELE